MKRAIIIPEKCMNCEMCLVETDCPKKAIIRESIEDKPWIDFYRCSGCMKCLGFCKNEGIREVYQPCDGKARSGW